MQSFVLAARATRRPLCWHSFEKNTPKCRVKTTFNGKTWFACKRSRFRVFRVFQNLAPHWQQAATDLKGKVKVCAVDATVHSVTANKYGVRSDDALSDTSCQGNAHLARRVSLGNPAKQLPCLVMMCLQGSSVVSFCRKPNFELTVECADPCAARLVLNLSVPFSRRTHSNTVAAIGKNHGHILWLCRSLHSTRSREVERLLHPLTARRCFDAFTPTCPGEGLPDDQVFPGG